MCSASLAEKTPTSQRGHWGSRGDVPSVHAHPCYVAVAPMGPGPSALPALGRFLHPYPRIQKHSGVEVPVREAP